MKPMDEYVAELAEVDVLLLCLRRRVCFVVSGIPARLAILRHLALGDHRVVDLTAHLDLAQSTVSAHLACLRDCGLVESRPQGRASLFSLRHDQSILALLAAAERLLADTGDAVALCPRFGEQAQR